ncbi:MAG: SAF domain-containing protein [Actinomycetota bacterium]|nr:SAF domain-containing protein [Actinomycetota bacterium]
MSSTNKGLQPRRPERLLAALRARRRGGRRARSLRRAVAVLLLLAAAVLAVGSPGQAATGFTVLAVSRDLPAGAVLAAADLRVIRLTTVPDGALGRPTAAIGRTLSAGVRRGEIITDARVVPIIGPDPGPGRVAVPIQLADAATTMLLRPGAHVTVLAVQEGGTPKKLSSDAIVLAVPAQQPTTGGLKSSDTAVQGARLVILAAPIKDADALTAATLVGDIAVRFS